MVKFELLKYLKDFYGRALYGCSFTSKTPVLVSIFFYGKASNFLSVYSEHVVKFSLNSDKV